MTDVELLPLPAIERWNVTGDYAFPTATDPEGHAVDYDAHVDAMQSYARACVEANIAPLQAENARLAEALRWYAEQAQLCRKFGSEGDGARHALSADGGKRANDALAQEDRND